MTDRNELARIYRQNLEENIVSYLSKEKNIPMKKAMDIFYKSKLSKQIYDGVYGIENMDYKYLAEDLVENEAALFE